MPGSEATFAICLTPGKKPPTPEIKEHYAVHQIPLIKMILLHTFIIILTQISHENLAFGNYM